MARYYEIKTKRHPIYAYRGYLKLGRDEVCDEINKNLNIQEQITTSTLARIENLESTRWYSPDKKIAILTAFRTLGLNDLPDDALEQLDERYTPESI